MQHLFSTFIAIILLSGSAVAQHSLGVSNDKASAAHGESPAAQPTAAPFLDLANEQASSSVGSEQAIDTDMLINFVLWLVVILCLCALTAVGLRMLNRRGVMNVGAPSGTRVVESLSLGKHRFVQLVEIGGHSVLVASDAGGIQSVVPLAEEFSESLLSVTEPMLEARA